MTKNEFEKIKQKLQEQIGMWSIAIDEEILSDYTLGCFREKRSNHWKVYINSGHGRHRIRLETGDENEAFNELYSMANFIIENNKYI